MTQTPPSMPQRPQAEDYGADRFEGVTVSLSRLFAANARATGQALIQNKTFVDCLIEGPAVLLSMNSVLFDACDMGYSGGDPKSLLLVPMAKERVTGVIGFADCRFERCNFFGVGFTGTDEFLDQFMQALGPKTQPAAS